jgi:hypothetical protein
MHALHRRPCTVPKPWKANGHVPYHDEERMPRTVPSSLPSSGTACTIMHHRSYRLSRSRAESMVDSSGYREASTGCISVRALLLPAYVTSRALAFARSLQIGCCLLNSLHNTDFAQLTGRHCNFSRHLIHFWRALSPTYVCLAHSCQPFLTGP